MPLLIQIYAPLQSEKVSPLLPPHPRNRYRDECDRLLHVFGCVKKGCIGVKCLRSAQRNSKWASEGREKRRKARLETEAAKQKQSENPFSSSSNPFSAPSNAQHNPFSPAAETVDFGSMIFGGDSGVQDLPVSQISTTAKDTAQTEHTIDDAPNIKACSTLWPASGSKTFIPPRYLATDGERLSNVPTTRQAKIAKQLASMSLDAEGEDREPHKGNRVGKTKVPSTANAGGSEGWSAEAYEIMRVAGVEEVFLAFQERLEVSDAAEQVVRYEFGGVPLPYSGKSKPYNLLWTSSPAPGQLSAVTRAAYAPHTQQPQFKRYDTSCRNIARCPRCDSKRTFELQLMPNLVNIVERSLQAQSTKAGEQELGWATVWCFVCSADCLDGREIQSDVDEDGERLDWQGWREEVALVELED